MTELASLPALGVAFSDDAHAAYAALRPQRLAQSPNGLLAFLHYADVQAVLCDPQLKPTGLELLGGLLLIPVLTWLPFL